MQMCWKKIGIGVAVCLAIGIVAMSRSVGRDAPEHTPGNTEIQEHTTAHQQPVQTQTSHMYDSAFFVSLIQDTCEQVLPLTNLSVEIQEDGILAVSGLLQKEQAKKLLEQQTDSISQSYAAVLQMLPQALPVSCKLQIQAQDGTAAWTMLQLSAASMELPNAWMQTDMVEPLEHRFRAELDKTFSSISSIETKDGVLCISGECK